VTSHQRQQRALSAYVDGELQGAEVRHLEEHLSGCGECRLKLQDLERLKGLLRQGLVDPGSEVSPALWPGVRVRIESRGPEGFVQRWMREMWEVAWDRPRLSLAAAAFTGFLILSMGYLLWDIPVGRSPGQTVSVESGQPGVVVEAIEPEPGFRAMVLTTSGRGLKMVWVVPRERT
jgi:predicted anti-sigma-YlaC factor YlaD